MNKPPIECYEKFAERFKKVNSILKKDQYLVHYFITAHPGSTLEDAYALYQYLKKKNIYPDQIQDFILLPMTLSVVYTIRKQTPSQGKRYMLQRHLRSVRCIVH